MKTINNIFLYVIIIFISIFLFSIKENIASYGKKLDQVSIDIQDLTYIIQQGKIMKCIEEGNKRAKSLKEVSNIVTECRDLYKTKSKMMEEIESENTKTRKKR